MATLISVHSLRGGTGKSNTTADLAALYAQRLFALAIGSIFLFAVAAFALWTWTGPIERLAVLAVGGAITAVTIVAYRTLRLRATHRGRVPSGARPARVRVATDPATLTHFDSARGGNR